MAFWPLRRPTLGPLEPWQRNQYIVVLTVALAHIAFDLTQPFIPLYVFELGITDLDEASFWSGVIVGIGPLMGSIMGPFWGSLADKYGRKPMVLRALVMIGVLQVAIAFVTDIYTLVGLRVVMGIFAGFTPMAMALAIAIGPRDKMAHAIGLVQAATFLPLAIGPTIGGVLSDTYGLRFNFMLTGVLLLAPAALLYFMVQENSYGEPVRKGTSGAEKVDDGERGSFFSLLALPGFGAALAILFLTRFTDRALTPVIPLYLLKLDTPASQLATITGFVVAAGAIAAAGSSVLYGKWARPGNTRKLLMLALAGGALFSGLISFVGGWGEVALLRIGLGLLAGGSMSLAYTLGATLAPASRSGLTLSTLSSCGQLGGALAPIAAGAIGGVSLAAVFVTNAVAYLVALGLSALPSVARATAKTADERAPVAS